MGSSNNGNMTDLDINDWVVVSTPSGRYFGRIAGDLNKGNIGGVTDLAVDPERLKALRQRVVEAVSNGDCIELCPALDFLAPLRPVQTPQGMAMQRDPIVVPIDFTVHETSVFVKAASIYFCADLKDADKKTYKELATAGLRSALEARAAASGLMLASGPVPPSGKVVPSRG